MPKLNAWTEDPSTPRHAEVERVDGRSVHPHGVPATAVAGIDRYFSSPFGLIIRLAMQLPAISTATTVSDACTGT